MDDGQCKAGGDGRVDGVAAGLHHVDAGLRGQFIRAHDHRMLGVVGTQSGRIGSRAEPEQERENQQLAVEVHASGEPLETAPSLIVKLRG